MFSTGQICKENFHPFGDSWMTSLEVWMFATGRLLIQLFQSFVIFTMPYKYIIQSVFEFLETVFV